MFNSNAPSLSDIAAVTKNSDGWGDGNGWWILIILFAIFGGWGNNGYGNNGYDAAAATTQADIQRGFDSSEIMSKLNGLENGMCSLGYDQLSQMNNINQNIAATGYGIQNSIATTGCGIQNAIQQNTVAGIQQTNALQSQIADVSCQNREAIAQVRYDMATDTCAVTTAINQAEQEIMQNCNANYRQLHDELVQAQLEAKNEKIAEQQSIIQSLNLAASQQAQNNYIVNQLRPSPIPAYTVANPYSGSYGYCAACNA